jgi:hypothetical protein
MVRVAGRRGLAEALLLATGAAALLAASGCRRERPQIARSDAAVVVMQAPIAVPVGVKTVVREVAPATKGGPMPLALAEGGALAVEGVLEAAAEEDLYLVQLESATAGAPPPATPPAAATADGGPPPTQQLSVEITPSETLATRIALRDGNLPGEAPPPAGKTTPAPTSAPILASSRATAGKRHALPNLAVAVGGRYLLSVRRADAKVKSKGREKTSEVVPGPASYLLVLRASPLGAADEREPNDTPVAATVTGPAHAEPQLAGFLGGPGDRDIYRVPFGHVSGQSRLLVEIAPSAEGTATLTATDAQGRRVAQARGRRGERVALRGLTANALAVPGQADAGFFYVEVTTEGAGDPFRRYVLGVRSDPVPETDVVDAGALPGATPR